MLVRKTSFYDGENQLVDWKFVIGCLFVLSVYVGVGLLFYILSEGWSVADAFFFTVITVTTLGISDLYPDNYASKLFTIFYILVGITMAGYALSRVGIYVLSKEESIIIKGLDVTERPGFSWSRLATILTSLALVIFAGAISATYAFEIDFVSGLYFAVVICTTVGYGDIKPVSAQEKVFFSFYALLATCVTTACLGAAAEMFMEHQQKKIANKILNTVMTIDNFAFMDQTGDGKVSEQEFLEAMLVALGKVRAEDIEQIKRRFNQLDYWNDGLVDPASMSQEDYSEAMAADLLFEKGRSRSIYYRPKAIPQTPAPASASASASVSASASASASAPASATTPDSASTSAQETPPDTRTPPRRGPSGRGMFSSPQQGPTGSPRFTFDSPQGPEYRRFSFDSGSSSLRGGSKRLSFDESSRGNSRRFSFESGSPLDPSQHRLSRSLQSYSHFQPVSLSPRTSNPFLSPQPVSPRGSGTLSTLF
eukprot:TRINITY_DN1063_c0_g1_i2.p1 TRINITY_DN1063_c0_g1~~TRINITY_DN1063_c0_g1_i2.p1  ORF type:complete len:481 (-),score=64.69 TRINITY_DN1063_c0_g1_i2:345-1787(-)